MTTMVVVAMVVVVATGQRVARKANQKARAQTRAKERASLGGIDVSSDMRGSSGRPSLMMRTF